MTVPVGFADQTPPAPITPPGGGGYGISSSVVTLADPNGVQAEAIRAVRTHLMAQHVSLGRRALAVCAPNRGVGCTFVATNLAVALSRIGVKVLLVDGDLRRPSIDLLIKTSQPKNGGLSACLKSTVTAFNDHIDAEVLPGLSILYAGRGAIDPQELLASDRFKALIDFCLREFDITIIDTPPSNISSDARQVTSVVGYGLIVTGRDKTFVHDAKTLAEQLQGVHVKIVGSVFNKA